MDQFKVNSRILWTDTVNGGELRFYPDDLMETGSDLLRPWVARMIMFRLYRTEGTIPFKHVYMPRYGTRRKGQKMSKEQGQCHQSYMDTLSDAVPTRSA